MRAVVKIGACAACIAVLLAGCGGGGSTRSTPSTPSVSVSTASVPSPTATPTAARPRTNLQSMFEDDNLVTDNASKAMSTFNALGVQTVRVFVHWSYLAPDSASATTPHGDQSNPDFYSAGYWPILDSIVDAASAAHIRVLFDVGAPAPVWAEGKDPKGSTGGWKPNATDFKDFMEALGTRYSGHYTPSGQSSPLPRVSAWSIWNEPNYIYVLPNAVGARQTPYAPRLYRALVDGGWSGLAKTGHTPKTDEILIGETAPRGKSGPGEPGLGGGIYPLAFIRDLYCVSGSFKPLTGSAATTLGCPASGSVSSFRAQNPGLFDAAGFSDHPYSDTTSPSDTAGDKPDSAEFSALGSLEGTLNSVFKAYGSSRQIPIYNTEYGYKTKATNPTDGVSYQDAAAWDNETEYLSWLNPRIHSFMQYTLTDGRNDDFNTGLMTPTAASVGNPPATPGTGIGKPKPDVYDAYRMPLWLPQTTAKRGQRLEVWGCARPVNDEHVRSAKVEIQFAAGSSGTYVTRQVATIDPKTGGCYFTARVAFPASGTVRLRYDASGSTIVSRTQAITVH